MRRFCTPLLALSLAVAAAGLGSVARAQEDLAADAGRARGRDRAGRPTPEMVEERLRTLTALEGADRLAGDALSHARRALDRAEQLGRGGQLPAAERARQIAWAALTLASRQIARGREREALARARRRLAAAEARAARSRAALEHAMRQRARAAEQEREPTEESVVSETSDEDDEE